MFVFELITSCRSQAAICKTKKRPVVFVLPPCLNIKVGQIYQMCCFIPLFLWQAPSPTALPWLAPAALGMRPSSLFHQSLPPRRSSRLCSCNLMSPGALHVTTPLVINVHVKSLIQPANTHAFVVRFPYLTFLVTPGVLRVAFASWVLLMAISSSPETDHVSLLMRLQVLIFHHHRFRVTNPPRSTMVPSPLL